MDLMNFLKKYCWNIGLLILLSASCAGYKFKIKSNPLSQYNIKTLSIPMFFNRSSLPNAAGPLTKEISLLFAEFPDLRVYHGDGKKTDAILVGIISSPPSYRGALSGSGPVVIDSRGGPPYGGIGNRKKFNLNKGNNINLTLRLVLIKDPTHHDVDLILSPEGEYLYKHPKIIFSETLGVTGTFDREVHDNGGVDSGGVVNFTKNKGTIDKMIQDLAQNTARNFREAILYAF